MNNIASYGTWISPIAAALVADGSASILNTFIDDDTTYWCETRPSNQGRFTIVRCTPSGILEDATPLDFNVRTFVHEYGGGAFTVSKGTIYASHAKDSAIYVIKPNSAPQKLTQGQTAVKDADKIIWDGTRFADLRATPYGLVAVAEHHTPNHPVENFLALIDIQTGAHKKLASGCDFYASPAISRDHKKIAWLCWNQPNMPWTKTELWIADIDSNGSLKNPQRIAGEGYESILQPEWSPEGTLYFITDRDHGWWNIHRHHHGKIENICPIQAEIGAPLWTFDKPIYGFLHDKIFFGFNSNGKWGLGVVNLKNLQWNEILRPSTSISHVRCGSDFVEFLEGYPYKNEVLVQIKDTPNYPVKELNPQARLIDPAYISVPQHIAYPSNGRTAYGYYYAPRNRDFQAPAGEKPPLVIFIHGGPTSQARNLFQIKQLFWTSRGFAVLDVNYGGSTGYGRKYRELLNKNWGIVDVEDCVNGAKYLVDRGLVDQNKLVIRGGSAGGYTTLAALAFKNTFKAGGNYFGVADITALAKDTHKFEASYMDELVGKYPEEKDLWEARSPINSVDKINVPLIIFQGEDDPVVPKNQSIMIYEALKKRGVPVELHLYPKEEHGFKLSQNIIHSLNREAEFYLEVFRLDMDELD